MRIGLHADGGPGVGLGHVGRCAALAQAYLSLGAKPVFVDVPAACVPWLSARGFRCASSRSRRWDLLVVDSYRLRPAVWERLRRRGTRSLVVDDLGRFAGNCDWLLNGHAYAPSLRFRARPGAGMMLGPDYIPLRREYWRSAPRRRASARLRRVLVTLGGVSARRAVEIGIAAATTLPHAKITVVLGPLSGVRGLPPPPPNLEWRDQVPSLRPLLLKADAAVCAGGQTLYEAACVGTPALGVRLAANQDGNLSSLGAAGTILPLPGPGARGFSTVLRAGLRRLDRSPRLRAGMSAAGRSLVDGGGALRVARATAARSA